MSKKTDTNKIIKDEVKKLLNEIPSTGKWVGCPDNYRRDSKTNRCVPMISMGFAVVPQGAIIQSIARTAPTLAKSKKTLAMLAAVVTQKIERLFADEPELEKQRVASEITTDMLDRIVRDAVREEELSDGTPPMTPIEDDKRRDEEPTAWLYLPGGFKPPHRGHFDLAWWFFNGEDAQMGEAKSIRKFVVIGGKPRTSSQGYMFTPQQSKDIWDIYKEDSYLADIEPVIAQGSPYIWILKQLQSDSLDSPQTGDIVVVGTGDEFVVNPDDSSSAVGIPKSIVKDMSSIESALTQAASARGVSIMFRSIETTPYAFSTSNAQEAQWRARDLRELIGRYKDGGGDSGSWQVEPWSLWFRNYKLKNEAGEPPSEKVEVDLALPDKIKAYIPTPADADEFGDRVFDLMVGEAIGKKQNLREKIADRGKHTLESIILQEVRKVLAEGIGVAPPDPEGEYCKRALQDCSVCTEYENLKVKSIPGGPGEEPRNVVPSHWDAWKAYVSGHVPKPPHVFFCTQLGMFALRDFKKFLKKQQELRKIWNEAKAKGCEEEHASAYDEIIGGCMEDPTSYISSGRDSFASFEKMMSDCAGPDSGDPDAAEWENEAGSTDKIDQCLIDFCEQSLKSRLKDLEGEMHDCMFKNDAYVNPDDPYLFEQPQWDAANELKKLWADFWDSYVKAAENLQYVECTEELAEECEEELEDEEIEEPEPEPKPKPQPEPEPEPEPEGYDPGSHTGYVWLSESESKKFKTDKIIMMKYGNLFEIPYFMEKFLSKEEKKLVRRYKFYKGNDWGNYPYRGRRTGYSRFSDPGFRYDTQGNRVQQKMMDIDGYVVHLAPIEVFYSLAERMFPNPVTDPSGTDSWLEFQKLFAVREEEAIRKLIDQRHILKYNREPNSWHSKQEADRALRYWNAVKHEEGPDVDSWDY